jgi:hypothetical protein
MKRETKTPKRIVLPIRQLDTAYGLTESNLWTMIEQAYRPVSGNFTAEELDRIETYRSNLCKAYRLIFK